MNLEEVIMHMLQCSLFDMIVDFVEPVITFIASSMIGVLGEHYQVVRCDDNCRAMRF